MAALISNGAPAFASLGSVVASASAFRLDSQMRHAERYFRSDVMREFTYDKKAGSYMPCDGRTYYNATEKRLASHFMEGTLDSNWDVASGSAGTDPTILATAGEGVVRLTTGATGNGTASEDASALAGPAVHYEAEEGILKLRCRFKIDAITNVNLFIGFTDVLPSGTLEKPWHFSDGTTYVSTASDSCGILFDTTATSDTIRLVGVAGDTEATPVDTAIAPVAATYMDLVIRVSATGTMEVEIDGTDYGDVASAVTVGTDLVPIAFAIPLAAAARNLDVDCLLASQGS